MRVLSCIATEHNLRLVLLAAIGPLAGKLSSAEKNDASSFLPSKAESTKVLNELKSFPGGDAISLELGAAGGG